MSEINKSKPKRISLQVSTSLHPFAAKAALAINKDNPSLFESVKIKDQTLSISIFDFDTYLYELRKTGVGQFDWQQLKRAFVTELQSSIQEADDSSVAIRHQLKSCLEIRFAELPTSDEQTVDDSDFSNRRMTEIP